MMGRMIGHIFYVDVLKICTEDILSAIKPTEDDQEKRLSTIQEVTEIVNSVGALSGASVKPFGSFVSALYAKSADVDVSVHLRRGSDLTIRKIKKQNALRELMAALQIRGVARSMRFVPTARVPVLQYMSNRFGISCDISINNYSGEIKSRIFYLINTIDDRFGDVVLLVKEWAKSQNINDPKNGTLNSYSLCLLVLFHFQTCEPSILPPLNEIYDGNVAEDNAVCMRNIAIFHQKMRQRNQSSVSQLLASFFRKFSRIGDLSGQVISTYTGRLELIQNNRSWMTKSYSLFIEDPFERPDNAARAVGVEELQHIGGAFKYVTDRFTNGALFDWNELVSLLCTPTVRSILRDRAKGYMKATADQQHQQPRSLTGSRSTLTSQWSTGLQTAQPSTGHATAGPYWDYHRYLVYTSVVEHKDDDLSLYASRRERASQHHKQHRRSEYSPYQPPSPARYKPVGGQFHNGSSEYSSYQSASTTRYEPVGGQFHNGSEYPPYQSASTTMYKRAGWRINNGPTWDYGA